MNDAQVEQIIRKYLPQVIHMSLATCHDNKPWVCEVHFSYDDELNLYFISLPSRRHSQEIIDNLFVAGNIVTQHALNQKVRGVYFEGRAEMLGDVDESHPAFKAANGRFAVPLKTLQDAKTAEGGKFFKISVHDYYLFDGYESVPATKYHLAWQQ